MAINSSAVPLIAITPDDGNDSDILITKSLGLAITGDALTDVEELDSDTGESKQINVFVTTTDDGLTDLEFIETSDEDEDDEPSVRPRTPAPLDVILDFQDSIEECNMFKGSSQNGAVISKAATKSSVDSLNVLNTKSLNVLNIEMDRLTDIEELDVSGDEDTTSITSDKNGGAEYLEKNIYDTETVDIRDNVLRSVEPYPSPAVTPEPLTEDDSVKRGSLSARAVTLYKRRTKHALSTRPEHAPVTDEIYPSDSDDVEQDHLHVQRRHRIRFPEGRYQGVVAETDVENLEFSGDESSVPQITSCRKSLDLLGPNHFPKFRCNQNKHNDLTYELYIDPQTDIEDIEAPDEITEEREQEKDGAESAVSLPLKEVESYYASVSVKHNINGNKKDSTCMHIPGKSTTSSYNQVFTSGNDVAVLDYETSRFRNEPFSGDDTDEDEVETSDTETKLNPELCKDVIEVKFVDVEGEARPVAISQERDQINVVSLNLASVTHDGVISDKQVFNKHNENYETENKHDLFIDATDSEVLTDFEDFDINTDTENSKTRMPTTVLDNIESAKFMGLLHPQTSVKQGTKRTSVQIVSPDKDSETNVFQEIESGFDATDFEDLSGESGNEEDISLNCPSPKLPNMDGGIVEASEVMKVEKPHKISLTVDDSQEPVTDTEEVYLDVIPSGRRRKSKLKARLTPIQVDKLSTTDVEDLEISDSEHLVSYVTTHLTAPSEQKLGTKTDVEDFDMSEEEDLAHQVSVTPDFIKNMDYNIISVKEGDGPFSMKAHQQTMFTSPSDAPIIKMISSSPDIYHGITTDTEEMIGSADEDAQTSYSRAETATPMEIGKEMEDHAVSTVHVKYTRIFNVDAPEEAVHVKDGDIREVFTDVEEVGFSEEESHGHDPKDRICVMDKEHKVCVCIAAENVTQDMVCICMGKHHEDLSMEWKTSIDSATPYTSSQNATQGQHEDWTEKSQEKEKDIRTTKPEEGEGMASSETTESVRQTTQTRPDGSTVTTTTTTTTTMMTKDQEDSSTPQEKKQPKSE